MSNVHNDEHEVKNGNVNVHAVCVLRFCEACMPHSPRFLRVTGMRRIKTFRSTTDRIYDSGPVRLCYYNIIL